MYAQYTETLLKSHLFKGIEPENLKPLLNCLNPSIRKYGKNDVIAAEGMRLIGIGLVLKGNLNISKTSISGNRILLGTAEEGELFGENAAFSDENVWPANVESQAESEVMFIKPASIVNQCSNVCMWHGKLQYNMLGILSAKAIKLTRKIEYLAIKGLKAKICTYLYNIYIKTGKKEIILPMKKYELAEFFNTARPSLSREMINLRNNGVIYFSGSNVKLLSISMLEKIIEGD